MRRTSRHMNGSRGSHGAARPSTAPGGSAPPGGSVAPGVSPMPGGSAPSGDSPPPAALKATVSSPAAASRPAAPMPFTRPEGGFTTPAAAVALLVALSLVFAGVGLYRVSSRSGQVQYVADAAALAADKAVAEFVTVGQVVDAILLTSSLAALALYAASAVCAFVPADGAALSTELAQAGSKVVEFRGKFASSAEEGLSAAQEALPAIAAARAAAVVSANADASGIDYAGAAVCVPAEGAEVSLSDGDELEVAATSIETCTTEIAEEVESREEAEDAACDAKRDAWIADCGESAGDRSMYERALSLAGLSGSSNQRYSSPEAWSFKAALARAKAYYAARAEQEPGESYDSDDPSEVTDSVCRKLWYQYAYEVVSEGSVTTVDGVEEVSLAAPATLVSEMRETSLYTDSIWPVSKSSDGTLTIHGYSGCPVCVSQESAGTASASDIASGAVETCGECRFVKNSILRVAAVSRVSTSGFEYHYLALVEAAQDYSAAVSDLDDSSVALTQCQEEVTAIIEEAVSAIAAERYDPEPPGRYGCIAIVCAEGTSTSSLPFVTSPDSSSSRVAISGATLAADPADSDGNVIVDIASGLLPDPGGSSTVLSAAFGSWGSLLTAYGDGTDAAGDALESVLSAIPLDTTALSDTASAAFSAALSSSGLEPADLSCHKPVLVNTSHILSADSSSSLSSTLLSAKETADSLASASTGDFSGLASQIADAVDSGADCLDSDALTVASLAFSVFGLDDAELSISVPDGAATLLADALESLGSLS